MGSYSIDKYEGYGVDLGVILENVDSTIRDVVNEIIEMDNDSIFDGRTEEVEIITPCNTDDFFILFLIRTQYTVYEFTKREIQTYSVEEANKLLSEAVRSFLDALVRNNELDNDQDNVIKDLWSNVPQLVEQCAGFDSDIGLWVDGY